MYVHTSVHHLCVLVCARAQAHSVPKLSRRRALLVLQSLRVGARAMALPAPSCATNGAPKPGRVTFGSPRVAAAAWSRSATAAACAREDVTASVGPGRGRGASGGQLSRGGRLRPKRHPVNREFPRAPALRVRSWICDLGGRLEGRRWQRDNPRVAEKLLAARPRKLPPANPASSEVVQRLPNNCPEVVEHFPDSGQSRPTSADSGHSGAQVGGHLDNLCPKFAKLGRWWPNVEPS